MFSVVMHYGIAIGNPELAYLQVVFKLGFTVLVAFSIFVILLERLASCCCSLYVVSF